MPERLALVGDHKCAWISFEEKPLGADQIRFRTEMASGKYGTWAAIMEGSSFADREFDHEMRIFKEGNKPLCAPASPTNPLAFGTAAIGVVTDIGANVKNFKPGDRVIAIPSDIRESNTVNQTSAWLLGDLDPTLALCAEPAYVSFHSVREANLRYGDSVAILGLGALGLIAVRMAKESGAERVFALDIVAGRRELAKKYGADVVMDPREGDVALEIHKQTGGAGVDVAIEISGSYAALETAIRCVRVTGTVCSAGFYRGDAKGLWLGREWHHNRLSMVVPHGCGWGHPPRDYPRWDAHRAYDAILSQMRRGRLNLDGLVNPVADRDQALDLFRMCRDEPDRIVKFAVKF
jgi:threonine dehydrogenase-like Zn-dependent dehydrogenase